MDDAPPARFPHADSPYHAHLGIEVAEWREGYARLVCDTAAPHANRSGIVHGGLVLSMIDQAAAFAGLFCPDPSRVRRAGALYPDFRFTGPAAVGTRVAGGGRGGAARLEERRVGEEGRTRRLAHHLNKKM